MTYEELESIMKGLCHVRRKVNADLKVSEVCEIKHEIRRIQEIIEEKMEEMEKC